MRWLETHRDELALCYPGEWIAVDGAELIAHAHDLTALMQLAAEKGHPNPFVTAVPEEPIDSLHL